VGKDEIDKLTDAHTRARGDLLGLDAERALIDADEAQLAESSADEYLGTLPPDEFLRRVADLERRKADLRAREERARALVRTLAARLVQAIRDDGDRKLAEIDAGVAAREVRCEELRAELAREASAIEADREAGLSLALATDEATREFLGDADPAAARKAAERERQRAERALWFARHAPDDPSKWPPGMAGRIREEITRLDEPCRSQQHLHRETAWLSRKRECLSRRVCWSTAATKPAEAAHRRLRLRPRQVPA
jgi:hypothetical protein